ncbi:hypothetical protein D3C86_1796920 [compost metagenome]
MMQDDFSSALGDLYIQAKNDLGPFLAKENFIQFASSKLVNAKSVVWDTNRFLHLPAHIGFLLKQGSKSHINLETMPDVFLITRTIWKTNLNLSVYTTERPPISENA